MKKTKYLILGAGITGLSMAYHLKGHDYAVYETEKEPGGMCRTQKVNGFLFDYGEHFIRADDEYVRKTLVKLLKRNLRRQTLRAAICLDGRLIDYPFQTNLYGLSPGIVKSCLLGYIYAWCNNQNKCGKEINNFEEWIYSTFGEGIAEYFMIPYNEKIWTVHPRVMTTDWFFNESVIPTGDLESVLEGALRRRKTSKKSVRWYPIIGGIQSLPQAFLKFAENVHFHKKAIEINPIKRTVLFKGGDIGHYEQLINTIPIPELVKIIVDVPSEIKKAAKDLLYNSVICVNLGVARQNLSKFHWIYFPERKYVFARAYFMMNFSPNTAPERTSSVSALISYSKLKPINKKNIISRVIDDFRRAGILKDSDRILEHSVLDIKYGYNLFTHDRTSNLKLISEYLSTNGISTIGRYGNWEYSGIEHSILNSRILANSLINDSEKRRW